MARKINIWPKIAQEFVLNLTGGLFIGYVLDEVFSVMTQKERYTCVIIMGIVGLLAASYRSWLIWNKAQLDG